jgi:alpha-galactosidase
VLAINQDALGLAASRVSLQNGMEVWVKTLNDGSKAIGFFNRSSVSATVTLNWSDAGLAGKQTLRNVWGHKDIGIFDHTYASSVPSHGVILLRTSTP